MSGSWKIIVVSPHRDDAAFSVGLSIGRWLDAGHTIQVLNCFTRSEYAPYSDVEALHPNDRTSFVTALRSREDTAWQRRYKGRLAFRDLDLMDAPLRLACAVDEVLTLDIRAGDRAVARVAGAVAKLVGQGSTAVIAPLAVGLHIDHRVARQAVLDTVDPEKVPLAFYEDLPYAARPEAAAELPTIAAAVLPVAMSCFASPPAADAAGVEMAKARMAECYDSQIDSDVVAQIAQFSRRYGGRERLWGSPLFLKQQLALAEESVGEFGS